MGVAIATVVVLAAITLTEALLPQLAHTDVIARYLRSAGVTKSQFRAAIAHYGLWPVSVSCSIADDVTVFEAAAPVAARPRPKR